MPGLYTRLSTFVPAPATLPLISRISRLQRLLSDARNLGGDESVITSAPSNAFQSAEALELRAIESGLGPISFISSRFAIGLVVMAIALNRMQNIVRPPPPSALIERLARQRLREARRAARARSHPAYGWRSRLRILRQQAVSAWKQTLTSPQALTALRLPAIALLLSSLSKLSLVLLQSAPIEPPQTLVGTAMYDRVLRQPMDTLLWGTFLSVCCSIAVGAFVAGITGSARGSSFNLFGFAFLLHLYSSPLTHAGVPAWDARRLGKAAGVSLATRPDWNVTFGIWLAVLELAWLQLSDLSEKWGRRRLIPTGVCGAIGMAHFAGTLLFNPARLPSFTFLTSLVSLGMLLVIVLTAALNFLTQVFTLGEVNFGELLPHSSSWPVLTDDWSIALLRLAGACLESSTVGGMGNEVASLRAPKQAFLDLAARSSSSSSGYEVVIQNQDRSTRFGFGNLIRDLRAEGSLGATQTSSGSSQPFPASPLGDWSQDSAYLRELKSFGSALWRWLIAAAWWALGLIPGARWAWNLGTQLAGWAVRIRLGRRGIWLVEIPLPAAASVPLRTSDVSDAEEDPDEITHRLASDSLYARFLAGEAVDEQTEDDDPDFEYIPPRKYPQRGRSHSSCSSSSTNSSGSDDMDDEADGPLATYSELPPSPSLPPVLLAHMTSASPLTRSRYRGLILQPSAAPSNTGAEAADIESVIRQRRVEASFSRHGCGEDAAAVDDDEATLPPCAVCWAGRREILLIPCLCLAMCAECRAHMAVKTAAKDHTCPCCRTKVSGYSRIYIP